VRFEVTTAVKMTVLFFRVKASRRFVGRYCLHLQPWRQGHYISPKHLYLPTHLRVVVTHKHSIVKRLPSVHRLRNNIVSIVEYIKNIGRVGRINLCFRGYRYHSNWYEHCVHMQTLGSRHYREDLGKSPKCSVWLSVRQWVCFQGNELLFCRF
jgi:hypothetical protein